MRASVHIHRYCHTLVDPHRQHHCHGTCGVTLSERTSPSNTKRTCQGHTTTQTIHIHSNLHHPNHIIEHNPNDQNPTHNGHAYLRLSPARTLMTTVTTNSERSLLRKVHIHPAIHPPTFAVARLVFNRYLVIKTDIGSLYEDVYAYVKECMRMSYCIYVCVCVYMYKHAPMCVFICMCPRKHLPGQSLLCTYVFVPANANLFYAPQGVTPFSF